ncbi:MAG: hypothetical protein ACI398_07450 [Clostridium sp.]
MKYMFFKLNSKAKENSYNNSNSTINSCNVINIESYLNKKNNTIDDKITKFFFDSVHKNYLRNR